MRTKKRTRAADLLARLGRGAVGATHRTTSVRREWGTSASGPEFVEQFSGRILERFNEDESESLAQASQVEGFPDRFALRQPIEPTLHLGPRLDLFLQSQSTR